MPFTDIVNPDPAESGPHIHPPQCVSPEEALARIARDNSEGRPDCAINRIMQAIFDNPAVLDYIEESKELLPMRLKMAEVGQHLSYITHYHYMLASDHVEAELKQKYEIDLATHRMKLGVLLENVFFPAVEQIATAEYAEATGDAA
jgi:hypothetical protein